MKNGSMMKMIKCMEQPGPIQSGLLSKVQIQGYTTSSSRNQKVLPSPALESTPHSAL